MNGTEQNHQLLTRREIFFQPHPRAWAALQIPAVIFKVVTWRSYGAVYLGSFRGRYFPLHAATHHNLNRCHRFLGFVYQQARLNSDHKSIEIVVRPRKGSAAVCSRCHQPTPGCDQLSVRRLEFILFWCFWFLCCTRCGAAIATLRRVRRRGGSVGRRQA
jgi:hypothetical protein